MFNIKKIAFSLLILYPVFLSGQKYIKDSVIISLDQNITAKNTSFQIYNLIDNRPLKGNIFTISEKKQYGIIPVDCYYMFNDSLSTILKNYFTDSIKPSDNYIFNLRINYISPSLRKGGIISQFYLNGYVSVYNVRNDTGTILGSLVYETSIPYKQARKNTALAYEKLFTNWENQLNNDLNSLTAVPEELYPEIIPNFRPGNYNYHKNLYSMLSFFGGSNWYGFEGEMFFSAPETGIPFMRNTSTFRYINGKNYESVLFGKNNENFFQRINDNLLFEIQSKILIGLNRWKDIDYNSHGLEEIIQGCISLDEQLMYNKIDQKGINFSIGLIEDVYYIYDKFDFRLGLKLSIGLKL